VLRDAIDLRRLPWIRPLVNAYAHDFASVAALFAGNPADEAAWRETIARVQKSPRDRSTIARVLGQQLTRRGAPPAAQEAASLLARPDTVAIVTGQQAGVFGGPLYTMLKAVTAIQLARRVRDDHGVPAVALFWVDAEDHDWDEISSASLLDRDFALREVTLDELPGAGDHPVARLRLDERVETTLSALETLLPPSEFTTEVMAALRRRYRPGEGVASVFAGWIEDLLGAQGLVVFEADDRDAKPLVAELFERELTNPCRTGRLAREAGALMKQLGHAPQVEPAEDAVALFYLDESGRRPIKKRGHDFAIGDETRTAAEIRGEARSHPERFSPNVLLRPLVQDRLFPTVCYIAGPSELAYQAQLGGVYREFGVEAPLLYPRASVTLLDSAAARFFEKHDLPLEGLHAQDESALNRLLESQLPPIVDEALDATERFIADQMTRLKSALPAVDPTLAGVVDTTQDRLHDTLKSLQSKIIQASKRKDETLRRQFMRTRALTFPGGHPQERVLCLAFVINRYRPLLGERLIDVLPVETDRHYVLAL